MNGGLVKTGIHHRTDSKCCETGIGLWSYGLDEICYGTVYLNESFSLKTDESVRVEGNYMIYKIINFIEITSYLTISSFKYIHCNHYKKSLL